VVTTGSYYDAGVAEERRSSHPAGASGYPRYPGPIDTGFPSQDAQTDFTRARRRHELAQLARRLRREPDDINVILPFDEVVEALGRRGERRLGLHPIDLDSIVGTVDRSREFDRAFRPTSRRVRHRWERIAKAMRKGDAMPPIDVYRMCDLHFVRDGHHRVSVARQLGLEVIDAYVTEIVTEVGASLSTLPRDLWLKSHERLFWERVPLPGPLRDRIRLRRGYEYGELAETVEAWGLRAMQAEGAFMTREQVAEAWFRDEYEPAIELLHRATLIGGGTETEAYMRVSALRYLLLRTHEWDNETLERLRDELRHPAARDTTVHRLVREMK
jgi:hypothetical protein